MLELTLRGLARSSVFIAVVCFGLMSNSANAALAISTAPTNNVVCSGGICAPTASDAVLNVKHLEHLLASGDVLVTTTGAGVQAGDIDLTSALSWSSAAELTLDAYNAMTISSKMSVSGGGGLSLITNDGGSGGTLSFGGSGRVTFPQLTSTLSINGNSYVLVGTIAGLASEISGNPNGFYALANSITKAGQYYSSPVSTTFLGAFEGLGNTISGLRISSGGVDNLGLFSQVGADGQNVGSVNDLRITNSKVNGGIGNVGMAVAANYGSMSGDSASGTVTSPGQFAGGLVGLVGSGGSVAYSFSAVSVYTCYTVKKVKYGATAGSLVGGSGGTISNSYATGSVGGCQNAVLGGLVGGQSGTIEYSFATGAIMGPDDTLYGGKGDFGGLVGVTGDGGTGLGQIIDCYATGSVTGGSNNDVGGLIGYYSGYSTAALFASYSTGAVSAGTGSSPGGLIGFVYGSYGISDDYWDVDTSGTSYGVNNGNISGVTGLTTAQFQAGLPAGFDPSIWAETSGVNNGFPYLISNPSP